MTPADTEARRFQCEVRHVLKMRTESQEKALAHIGRVTARRGSEAGKKLRDECAKQWGLGNRGEWGRWEYLSG